ncbi:MAG: T9SS type A sorting domain-containing protein [Ignavibacteria bacterium]|nr:T9SS type A sorting domain-containing protein [Ignavibacteria bacterium]
MSLDNLNNVCLAGNSTGTGGNLDIVTVKYSQSTGIQAISENIPAKFYLFQNYPNPFNPSTNLEFGISDSRFASLKIYDLLGNEVATLVNERLNQGTYKVKFNGNDLSSGIYFYRLSAGDYTDTKRMLLIK